MGDSWDAVESVLTIFAWAGKVYLFFTEIWVGK
jgi:hypothetical protein